MSENDEKSRGLRGAHFDVGALKERPAPAHMAEEEPVSESAGSDDELTEAVEAVSEPAHVAGVPEPAVPAPAHAAPAPAHIAPESEPDTPAPAHIAPEPEPVPEPTSASAPAHAARRKVPLAAKVLTALLAVIVVAVVAGMSWISSLDATMSVDEEDREELNEALAAPQPVVTDPFYVLLIGSDARKNDTVSRSDTIMLARVDIENATVSLVSIPRDTMVMTEGGYVDKFNSIYNNGPAATVRAVSEFAGVDITHYVEVDFNGVKDVVDALGGITVDVPEDIDDYKAKLTLSAGEQVLDGATALKYARARYDVTGGDFGRVRAQRQVVEAIARKVLASSPVDLPGVVTELAESIKTDLSVTDIISYALAIQQNVSGLTIFSATTPSYGYDYYGVSYVATMYDEWRAMMQRMDAGLDPADEGAAIPEEQLANERLGAASNGGSPRDYYYLAAVSGFTSEDIAEFTVEKPGQPARPGELIK